MNGHLLFLHCSWLPCTVLLETTAVMPLTQPTLGAPLEISSFHSGAPGWRGCEGESGGGVSGWDGGCEGESGGKNGVRGWGEREGEGGVREKESGVRGCNERVGLKGVMRW